MPLWEDVSMQLAEEDPRGKRKLVMGKFDCEQVRPSSLESACGQWHKAAELMCVAAKVSSMQDVYIYIHRR